MKYRLKIPFYDMGIKYDVGDLLMEDSDKYAIDSSNRFFRKDFVENNPDIFEKVEEPQEEVIEGFIRNKAIDNLKYIHSHIIFSEKQTDKNTIPATLIINPKPRKEYVRWVMKEFIDNLENNYPIYRVLSTESDYEKYCHKIKIIVEEEN